MKKYLGIIVIMLLAVVITGCGGSKTLKKDSSPEDLLDIYMEGFKNADLDKLLSVYPDFTKEYYQKYITKERLQETLDYYGNNTTMSYNLTGKEKLSDEDLDNFKEDIKNAFTNPILPSECYKLNGTTTIKGSKDEHTSDISELWYCNFDGTWRLLGD